MNFNLKENLNFISHCFLPTYWGIFKLYIFLDKLLNKEHLAIVLGRIKNKYSILTRIHSECLTGDSLLSQRCDCGYQLNISFKKIYKKKLGLIIYLRQEGRNIGLLNKIRTYKLQDLGFDTVDANLKLGFPIDLRNYNIVYLILKFFKIKNLILMTNNPNKLLELKSKNIFIIKRIPLIKCINSYNKKYLLTKHKKLGHFLFN